MSNKTPYEIRSDLLHLAYQICLESHRADAEKVAFDNSNTTHATSVYVTTSPTTEEVVAQASKLNDFVSLTDK